MQIKIFTIPIDAAEREIEELNKFLRSQKIVSVEQQFCPSGAWSFCVRYMEGVRSEPFNSEVKNKIDYKTVLSEKEFSLFSLFRERRKKMAQDEALPAFAIFTDAEMAEICKLPELTVANLKNIKGIAIGKVERYGERLLTDDAGKK